MTQEVTALLAFCEGTHDLAFVRRVLRSRLGFEKVDWQFSEFPAPVNSLFRQNVERHAAQDLSLDMAHKFYLPDHVLRRDACIAMLFNSGGKDKAFQIKNFLADYLQLLPLAETFPQGANALIARSFVLFLNDADSHGALAVRTKIKQDFATVDGRPWLTEDWSVDPADPAGAVAADIGAYVWGDENGVGTLEDLLIPIHRATDFGRVDAAEQCIDGLFNWDVDHDDPKRRIAERARRYKAVIALLGQRKKPGMSQSVMIGQTKIMSDAHFCSDDRVSSFAAFLARFLGMMNDGTLTDPQRMPIHD